jgi:conjugative relaxase-like TrwC/TraI family protein
MVMLSIGKIAAGPRAARYYTEQVAQARDDYYSGEGEEPGTWVGSGASALGLTGEVDDERFAGLLAGAGLRKPP